MSEKKKKPIYKRVWFWILVVIIVAGVGSSNGKKDEEIVKKDSKVTSGDTQKKDENSKKDENPKIGEVVKVGDFEYKVKNVSDTKKVEFNQFAKKETQANFVVVEMEVKNVGKEAKTLDGSMFEVIGVDGTKYKSDWEATMWANEGDDGSSTFLNQMNPNIPKNIKIVFETAKKSTKEEMSLQVSGGIISTKKAIILLKK